MSSFLTATLFLSAVATSEFAYAQRNVSGDDLTLSAPLNLTTSTNVPNVVLSRGEYSIRILDHLSDRVVLQIAKTNGKVETTFLGVQNAALRQDSPGAVLYGSSIERKQTVRGYAFSAGSVEFVYPKETAVAIAKANKTTVLAIDPASEARPEAKSLSKDDFTMVTLWSLTPTRVGPSDHAEPAIAAAKYQGSHPAPITPPVQVARNSIPQSMQRDLVSQKATTSGSRANAQVGAALPHTASKLPLILLGGLCSFIAAALLDSFRRLRRA